VITAAAACRARATILAGFTFITPSPSVKESGSGKSRVGISRSRLLLRVVHRRLLFRNFLEDCRRSDKHDHEYFDRHGNHLLSNVLTVGLLGPEELRFRPG